jgi:hypothetical protein
MGLITKYQIEFPALGTTVSNDVFSGQIIIDADITVEMLYGTSGCHFEIKLYDLPKQIFEGLVRVKPFDVKVKLGYFDGDFEPVLEGVANKAKIKVDSNRLVTELKGMEAGTYALKKGRVEATLPPESTFQAAITQVLREATFDHGSIDTTPVVQNLAAGTYTNRTLRGRPMAMLAEIAREAEAELFVMDKKVYMGAPVSRNDYLLGLHPDENLSQFHPFKDSLPKTLEPRELNPLAAAEAQGFRFISLGEPKLRPTHVLQPDIEGYLSLPGAEYRVSSVRHSFTITGGYVCDGAAVKVCQSADCRRQQEAVRRPTADAIAARVSSLISNNTTTSPPVEMGRVKLYSPGSKGVKGHRANLYFGEPKTASGLREAGHEQQPSMRVEVPENEDQVFNDKPVISCFAWHKCGLVTPVYPGMKAVMLHNRGLRDDPMVGGFVWSEQRAIEPPPSLAGDYWLCLPVDPPSDSPPANDTKTANDLVGSSGKRVIEAKGLKITVGTSKLRAVGQRPDEGADDEIEIEHSSGSRITIASDGKITISSSEGIEIVGDLTVKGNLDIP